MGNMYGFEQYWCSLRHLFVHAVTIQPVAKVLQLKNASDILTVQLCDCLSPQYGGDASFLLPAQVGIS